MLGVFSPESKYRFFWDVLTVILTVYAAIEIPLHVVFNYQMVGWVFWLDILVDIVFAMDILINFRTAIRKNGKDVTDVKLISKNYLKTWFSVDMLAALPMESIVLLFVPVQPRWISAFRLIRLIKVARIPEYFSKWQMRNNGDNTMYKLLIFLFWFLLTAHLVGGGWLLLDGIDPTKYEGAARYLRGIYWCITTLATVGYGDITPQDTPQTLYTVIVMILGVAIYGYVIGNVTSLLANINVAKNLYIKEMEKISAFSRVHNLPAGIQDRIHKYNKYLWESRLGYSEDEIVSTLPQSLRVDIALFMHREIIAKVPLFRGASEKVIRDLVCALKPVVIAPVDYIFEKGDDATEMYFIHRGIVDICSGDGQTILATLCEGSFFGEVALITGLPRNASARAREFCDLYILPRTSFDRIVAKDAEFAAHMVKAVAERTGAK